VLSPSGINFMRLSRYANSPDVPTADITQETYQPEASGKTKRVYTPQSAVTVSLMPDQVIDNPPATSVRESHPHRTRIRLRKVSLI
jgi:hypothetical protein